MASGFSWRQSVGEGAFVLAGILLAFWIDAWWDGQQEARAQAEVLSAVRAEAIQNRVATLEVIENAEARNAAIDQFFRLEPGEVPELQAEMPLEVFLIRLMNPQTLDPALGASQLLLASPISGDNGVAARTLMNTWLEELADAQPRRDALWTQSQAVVGHMAAYAERYASEGRQNVPEMAARGGLQVVADLRTDADFVQALSLKAHWQDVYTLRLRMSLPVLDSLILLLEGG